ncbi:hypothetical protein [Actinomadura meridiana]
MTAPVPPPRLPRPSGTALQRVHAVLTGAIVVAARGAVPVGGAYGAETAPPRSPPPRRPSRRKT